MRFLRGYLIGLAFLTAVVGVIWGTGGYVVEGAGAFGSAAVGAALLPIGVLLLGFILFEPAGLYGIWLKTKHYFSQFPHYQKGSQKDQKSHARGESW